MSKPATKRTAQSSLDLIQLHTKIVADTGDIEAIDTFRPEEATTNPSLILAAAKMPKYKHLLDKAIQYGNENGSTIEAKLENAMDYLCVLFGCEILKFIPGRVSTEVDARISFDTNKSIAKALKIISLYKKEGVDKDRILIKLAATWEGIQAAKVLEEKHKIHCNLTLIFSLVQAAACAEAGVTLISPFVGRISDWYVANTETKTFEPSEDPGVVSVRQIYNYFKKFGYKTQIMGASFRNIGQIKALVGCDLLTIGISLLEELDKEIDEKNLIKRKLDPEAAANIVLPRLVIGEPMFRMTVNDDQMANDKLSEGIRKFAADSRKLENIILETLSLTQ